MQPGLFQDAPRSNLLIFEQVRMEQVLFSLDVLRTFHRARILTFSASVSMIHRLSEIFDDLEIIFGYERPARDNAELWAMQKAVADGLLDEFRRLADRRQQALAERLREGTLRLLLLKKIFSHAKVFLLEGARRAVLLGSANISERALFDPAEMRGRAQLETLLLFYDPAVFDFWDAQYRELRNHAGLLDITLTRTELDPEEVPELREASQKGVVLVEVPVPVAVPPVFAERVEKLSRQYRQLTDTLPRKDGHLLLDRKHVASFVRLKTARIDEEASVLSLQLREDGYLVGETFFPLQADEEQARRDARLLVEFFEGYRDFIGPVVAQQRRYYGLLCWMYLTPLMSRLASRALVESRPPFVYPMGAIVYGQASAGKTALLDVLLRSMIGQSRFFGGKQLTGEHLWGLTAESATLPVVFDDVARDRFSKYGIAFLKDIYLRLPGNYSPVVFSMNAAERNAFTDDVRKRALLIYANIQLPESSASERFQERYRFIETLKQTISTHFYRRCLMRFLRVFESETLPRDFCLFASRVVGNEIERLLGRRPAWATPLSYEELQNDHLQQLRAQLLELWQIHRDAWQIDRQRVVLEMDETYEAHLLRKELPSYLYYAEHSKGRFIVFRRDQLETLLGRRLRRRIWPWHRG